MINLVHERTPMPEQSKDLRCKNFDEVALGYTPLEAVGEAMRCLNCREKPCVAGCPIHQQIPEFLARVAEGDFDGAYDVITQRSSLPAVCGRVCPQEQQCEKNCAHVRKGEAVAIGRLERFVADWHDAHTPISVPEVEKKGKKVAVIGSGPAGIACAGDLAALGYEVTVFEKLTYAGGILTYGIPTFVLPRSVVDRALEVLDDEERLVLDRFYIHRAKGAVAELCDRLNLEKSAVYDRRDKALRHFTLALYGVTETE